MISLNPISDVIELVNTVVSRIWPDKTEAGKLQALIVQQQLAAQLQIELANTDLLRGQIETNTEEAKSPLLFVSGWRPWIGWGLGTLFMFYVLSSTVISIGIALKYNVIDMPPMDPMVRDVILGLLGLGITSRSYEKIKNVTGSMNK